MKRLLYTSVLLGACYLGGAVAIAQQNIRLNTDAADRLQENPSIAVDSSGALLVSWSDQRNGGVQIFFTRSTDGGATWRQDMRISGTQAKPTGGMEMGPNITAGPGSHVIINWADIRRPPAWSRVDVCVAHSADGGVSFNGDPRINNDSIKSQHQPALAVGGDGTVYAAWHGFPEPGEPAATPVFVARSTDGGANFEPQRRVDFYDAKLPSGTIGSCNCCRPWVFTAGTANVYVVYRIDSADHRDIFLARSSDRGITWERAQRVSSGKWLFNACPSSGPVGLARNDSVYVTWMEQRDGVRSIFLARSLDGGRTFEPDVKVADDGNFPSIAVDVRGRVFITWNANGTKAPVYCAVSDDGGRSFGSRRTVNDTTPRAGNVGASIAASPDGNVYAVWQDTRRDAGDILFANLTAVMASSSIPVFTAREEGGVVITPLPVRGGMPFEIAVAPTREGLPRSICIIDVSGRTVASVPPTEGRHQVTLNGPGVFFVEIRYEHTQDVRPCVVVE